MPVSSVPLSTPPTQSVTGDIDNDGDLDLLTPNNGNNTVNVQLNGGGPLAVAPGAGAVAATCHLFPNPAATTAPVTIECAVPSGVRTVPVTVLNALGQTVASGLIEAAGGRATGTLPTTGLPAGVYTVRLQAGATTLTSRLMLL